MSDSTSTDADVVRRAQTGDRVAFGAIVAAHQSQALRLATIISGDSTEAYDIVQEAFVKAFQALPSIRTTDSLRPWLLRIVANQAKNVRRSRSRSDARMQHHIDLRSDDQTSTDAAALSALAAEDLIRAIRRLPDIDRSVIACRYFAELTEAETAAALDIANGTVKSRTARALRRLRAELGPEGNDA